MDVHWEPNQSLHMTRNMHMVCFSTPAALNIIESQQQAPAGTSLELIRFGLALQQFGKGSPVRIVLPLTTGPYCSVIHFLGRSLHTFTASITAPGSPDQAWASSTLIEKVYDMPKNLCLWGPSRRLRGVAPPPFSDDPEQHRPRRAKALTAVSQAIPLDHSAHAPPDDLHNAAAEAVSLGSRRRAKASSLHDAALEAISLDTKASSLHDAALEAVSLDSSAQAISLDHSTHAPPDDLHNAAAEVVSLGSHRRAKASSLHDVALEAVSLGSSAQAVSLDDSAHPPHDPSDAATKALSLGNSAPVHHKDVDADGPYEQVESEAARLKILPPVLRNVPSS
ncbi:hypothetical protein BS47DRAFT_1403222 [Hydnum rufescens UP504]|uniref:Uncharacterized protein n=1 Tax=Hydnum rufescens UP504 TaxID=1448309 RepID=A0A9P6AD12_9AGAM|nr:hypothetical protein BS47DRAFT_1403222 [Hydnum rufescens UP504]